MNEVEALTYFKSERNKHTLPFVPLYDYAILALQEKGARENNAPLTLEEVKQLDMVWVWCAYINKKHQGPGWCKIIQRRRWGYAAIENHYTLLKIEDYSIKWLAYKYEIEEF